MVNDNKFEDKKELNEEELKKTTGGVEIVNKESENNDSKRDFNRLSTLCDRRDEDTINSFNLMRNLVDQVDNTPEIKT